MDRDTIKMLLREIGVQGDFRGMYKDSGNNIQFCCPFHGETRPSCGINVDSLVGFCFACSTSFHITKLVAECMDFKNPRGDYNYAKAENWLEERYDLSDDVDLNMDGIIKIDSQQYYDMINNQRHEMEESILDEFKCGKVLPKYYTKRGFGVEDVKRFKIGWDSERNRIVFPVFWKDGTPCGCIGRAVLDMKNKDGSYNNKFKAKYKPGNDFKYYIYDNFPIGDILYPLPLFKPLNKTAILLEGQLDAQRAHQYGFSNCLATLGSKITVDKKTGDSKQIDLLKNNGVERIILFRDDDEAGNRGAEHDYKCLTKAGFNVYSRDDYPKGKSDPESLTKQEFKDMIDNAKLYKLKNLKMRRII